MRYIFPILLSLTLGVCLAEKPVYVVSIAPYKGLVQDIAGQECTVYSLLREGQDPHSFEFKPSTVGILEKASAYFTAGTELEMEVRLLPRLKKQYLKISFIDTSKGIKLVNNNPHVWVSVLNLKIIAENIKKALISLQPDKKNIFEANYQKIEKRINEEYSSGNGNFASHKDDIFISYHPAFIYFATEFHLIEHSVEDYGRAPSAKELQKLTSLVKENGIKGIVTRKGLNRGMLQAFIERNNLTVIELDHLSENYLEPLEILINKLPKYLVPVHTK